MDVPIELKTKMQLFLPLITASLQLTAADTSVFGVCPKSRSKSKLNETIYLNFLLVAEC